MHTLAAEFSADTRLLGRASRIRSPGHALASLLDGCELLVAHNFPSTVWAATALAKHGDLPSIWYCEEPRVRLHWRTIMPRLAEVAENPERHPWSEGSFGRHFGEPTTPKEIRRERLDAVL